MLRRQIENFNAPAGFAVSSARAPGAGGGGQDRKCDILKPGLPLAVRPGKGATGTTAGGPANGGRMSPGGGRTVTGASRGAAAPVLGHLWHGAVRRRRCLERSAPYLGCLQPFLGPARGQRSARKRGTMRATRNAGRIGAEALRGSMGVSGEPEAVQVPGNAPSRFLRRVRSSVTPTRRATADR